MIELLILTLVLVAGVALLSLFFNRYAEFCYKVLVVNRIDLINSIMLTEDVPPAWRVPLLDSAARRGESLFWRKVRGLLFAWYVRRLDGLARHIQISSYLKKDEKEEFLAAFAQIREGWVELGEG